MNTMLTFEEVDEITAFTIQKINNYPKRLGKTVENYFDILFPDELQHYLERREINRRSGFYKESRCL
jgi:hypothetical protein